MRTSFLPSIVLLFGLAAADLVPALPAHVPLARPQPRAEGNDMLGKRGYCPLNYDYCFATNGDAICQAVDEVCCQLATGTDPFTCPLDHPYCCGADLATGIYYCGADSSCGSDGFLNAPTAQKPTESTGVAGPTKTAEAAPSAASNPPKLQSTGGNSPQPTGGNSLQPTPQATSNVNSGGAIGMDKGVSLAGGVVLAVVVGIL